MKDYEQRDHLLIERAEGIFLYDSEERAYYDTISSWWVNPHGHNHPRIREAIIKQLDAFDHIQFSGFTHVPAIELAEKLVHLTPAGLTRVFYSDNGSTAVEVALKMCFQYWQQAGRPTKTKFVFVENSYHGDTLGAVSVGGVELFHSLYKPLLFRALKLPAPPHNPEVTIDGHAGHTPPVGEAVPAGSTTIHSPADPVLAWLNSVEQLFSEQADDIAGIVIEPMVQAAGGMNIYPAECLKGLKTLCERYHIHLIADEVAVGFGRTGKMFACDHAAISPDILCLSKALTGGVLPLSVTMCTDDIYDAFYDDYNSYKTFFHGHGYTANALACAAANASLSIYEEDQLLVHAEQRATDLRGELQRLATYPRVHNVRQIGLIAAFDLLPSDPPAERLGFDVYLEGLRHGIVLRPLGNVLYYWLPLNVTQHQIRDIIERTLQVLERVYHGR